MKNKSLDQLTKISKKIADKLSKNDCIFLIGEIGVGKTTLARVIINYLQKKNSLKITEVLSPTFNILYEYNLKNLKIMHYDLYRLHNSKDLNKLGIFSKEDESIKIIEWPKIIKTSIKNKLEIHMKYSKNENERNIKLLGNGKWENFLNEL